MYFYPKRCVRKDGNTRYILHPLTSEKDTIIGLQHAYLFLLINYVHPEGVVTHLDWHLANFFAVLLKHMLNVVNYILPVVVCLLMLLWWLCARLMLLRHSDDGRLLLTLHACSTISAANAGVRGRHTQDL